MFFSCLIEEIKRAFFFLKKWLKIGRGGSCPLKFNVKLFFFKLYVVFWMKSYNFLEQIIFYFCLGNFPFTIGPSRVLVELGGTPGASPLLPVVLLTRVVIIRNLFYYRILNDGSAEEECANEHGAWVLGPVFVHGQLPGQENMCLCTADRQGKDTVLTN